MKLQSSSAAVDVKTNMQMTSIKAELAQDKLHKMWDLLQSPYRDPIASLIREYVSNCFDSHIEAGVNTPVYVTLEEDQSGWYWACEDFGVGLSEDRCKNIFMKYLTSTKEETNDQIGAFGMGSKSGLGYTDVVHIRTRFDGTEYRYMLHKTTDAPTLALMDFYPTDKRNGTQIKIYLKDNWDEQDKFVRKTEQQLTYFDNVHYGGKLDSLNEDFVVYKGRNFQVKPSCTLKAMHLVIGNVAYPINWEAIGKTEIDIPIALIFEIGDLPVIFTREDIRYTDDAVSKIRNKIAAAEKELIDLATPKTKEIDDLQAYIDAKTGNVQVRFSDSYSLVLPEFLANQVDISGITYGPNPYLSSKCLKKEYYSSTVIGSMFARVVSNLRRLQNGRNISCNWYNVADRYRKTTTTSRHQHTKRILMDEPSDPRKNRWISQFISPYADLFVDNRDQLKLADYKYMLQLKAVPRAYWRQQIQWHQKWAEENFELFFDYKYSEIEVPDDFEKKAKASISRVVVGSGEIRYKNYRETETTSWGQLENIHVTADLEKSKIDELKSKHLVIWSTRSDDLALKCTYRMLQNFHARAGIKLISVAKKDAEVMEILEEQNENIISLNNWYLSENEILESFVFFSKFGKLVDLWNIHSVFRKPSEIPYHQHAKYSRDYMRRLPKEFIDHLLKIFELQGKELKMDKFPALRSWYKDHVILENTCNRLGAHNTDAKVIIACRMFPNRPVALKYRKIKSYLLINNL